MRTLLGSGFFLRFAGGFALGAMAVAGTQVIDWVGAVAHIA